MKHAIFVVTNEPSIARSYFERYISVEAIEFVKNSITTNLSTTNLSSALSAWIEETSEGNFLNFVESSKVKDKKYNIIFLPYSGLAYTVARLHAGYEGINTLVACINEHVTTQAVYNQQFNILLNGKFFPTFSFFKSLMELNGLKGESFRPILQDIQDGKIPFLPEYIDTLLGQLANG